MNGRTWWLLIISPVLWLVCAQAGERRGGLIATFVNHAALTPDLPRVLIGLAQQHHTWQLIEESGAFGLHLLGKENVAWVPHFGLRSGKTFDKLQSIKLASGDPDRGTEVPEFAVSDGKRAHRISAATLRRQLSVSTLYSPFFTISENGKSSTLHFEGRGHGHTVGLCQWGARGQSLLGKTGYEIVRYYYSGAKIVQLQ